MLCLYQAGDDDAPPGQTDTLDAYPAVDWDQITVMMENTEHDDYVSTLPGTVGQEITEHELSERRVNTNMTHPTARPLDEQIQIEMTEFKENVIEFRRQVRNMIMRVRERHTC